jgi:hypothetical protein
LDFLQTALNESHNGVPSRCAVYGMPGIGKTQLLLRYAKVSWDQNLYSFIFWISSTSIDRIIQGISGILDLIEHPDRYLRDQTAKFIAVRLWLEKYEGGDWLLVFDNVQRETLSFLRDHLPLANRRGNILFSTRTEDVAESLANAAGEQHRILGLQAMELRDTANLLVADAGIDAGMATPSLFSQAEDLVKHVGLLPLAVVQAASLIKQTHTTLDDMLELYKREIKVEVNSRYFVTGIMNLLTTTDRPMGKRSEPLRGAIGSENDYEPDQRTEPAISQYRKSSKTFFLPQPRKYTGRVDCGRGQITITASTDGIALWIEAQRGAIRANAEVDYMNEAVNIL